jgi:cytochrome c
MKTKIVSALCALLAGSAAAKFPNPPGCTDVTDSQFKYVKVVTKTSGSDPNLGEPLKMAFDLKAGNKVDIYWVERHGALKLFDATQNKVSTVGTLSVFTGNEWGLTGIALDPQFKSNGYVYLFYCPPLAQGDFFRVSRFTIKNGSLDAASEKQLLNIRSLHTSANGRKVNHTAGAMQFDLYGDLWIAVGKDAVDHPCFSDESNEAQSCEATSANPGDMRGGIVRIHPDDKAAKGYTIPAGNFGEFWSKKFAAQGLTALATQYADPAQVLPEIYLKGTRNAYSITVDPVRRWVAWGEFGPNNGGHTEEHNLVTSPSYMGFPYFAGRDSALGGDKDPLKPMNNSKWNKGPKQLPPITPAIHTYLQSGAVTGPIYRYDGDLDSPIKFPPQFDKAWFTSDWYWPGRGNPATRAYLVSDDGSTLTDSMTLGSSWGVRSPLDLRQGPDGALYMLSYGSTTFTANADAHIARIEYTGDCHPATPKYPKLGDSTVSIGGMMGPNLRTVSARMTDHSLMVNESGDYTVRISDAHGKEIAAKSASGAQEFVFNDMLHAAQGLFFLSVEGNGFRATYRLVRF